LFISRLFDELIVAMRYINAEFDSAVRTVFLIPPRDLIEVSSSFVKGLVGPAGWEKILPKYLPAPAYFRN
jgi:phosphopantetheine adenylyltransferase